MGLYVQELNLEHFRNFTGKTVVLSPELNLFLGPNASGKTNATEALKLLSVGRGFRGAMPKEQIQTGFTEALVRGSLVGDDRLLIHECMIGLKQRRFSINGKPCRGKSFLKNLMTVIFSPDDLMIIKGSSSLRREELDSFASDLSDEYNRALTTYTRLLEQKNHLLKEEFPDAELLDVWDEGLAKTGAVLILSRQALLTRTNRIFMEIYHSISSGETAELRYRSSFDTKELPLEKEALKDYIFQKLVESRSKDMLLGYTTKGPHRDDVDFLIENKASHAFGSQGQIRSLILALKLSEVTLVRERRGIFPLLILDDVMSELDETRRSAVLDLVHSGTQTVITAANPGYFSDKMLKYSNTITFGA